MAEAMKRPHDGVSADDGGDPEASDAKRSKVVDNIAAAPDEPDDLDDFTFVDGAAGDLLAEEPPPAEPADEVARRNFAGRVMTARQIGEADLPSLLTVLRNDAPDWAPLRRWRSASLLLTCVARSSRLCRGAFVRDGLPVLGAVMQESVAALETGDAASRQEAGMWALACLMCLRSLPLGRASLWEHRHSLGKPFDRLHRWCGREKSALAAELRAPTVALCKRWRRQPKPAGQEVSTEQKAMREKVVEVIAQGLMGIAGGNSPASPAPIAVTSPGAMPNRLVAVEVEAALYGRFGSASHEYKQHARMLRSNLAHSGNAKLRERVLTGDIAPEDLAAMDSAHLAPDSLQEQRRAAEVKAMKESVVEELLPRMQSHGEGSPTRHAFDWYTAPPVFVKSPARQNSEDRFGVTNEGNEEAPAEVPVAPLVPPPTPFRDLAASSAQHQSGHSGQDEPDPHDPEVLATPAPDDEDEEQEALIQYLAKPIQG
mmetsp:Transcript_66644/g.167970  ORF Transcript_66644/g.167970 Transcript_66644/m.167970 type:complete len:485 (+) Transcript_66644:130-1584(+)